MAVEMFRARYVELELLAQPESDGDQVLVRTVDGEDLYMDPEEFATFYVPVHSVSVDLSETFD